MDRLIIVINELSKDNWAILYRVIKSIVSVETIDSKVEAFRDLNRIAEGIGLKWYPDSKEIPDAYSLYGKTDFELEALSKKTCFSIIYKKSDEKEDFAELVPFTLLQHEFADSISLGIDISCLSDSDSYKFKCSDFFIFCDNIKPKLGKNSIYFIESVIDKQTGEVIGFTTSALSGKGKDGQSDYKGNPSRRFLPLIQITDDNYGHLFFENGHGESKEYSFIKSGIEQIRAEFKEKGLSQIDGVFNNESPFSQWLEAAYLFSYEEAERRALDDDKKASLARPDSISTIDGIRATLQLYKDSIQELVQNIIFHGDKEEDNAKKGLLYCVFDKKANISDSVGKAIPDFGNYDENIRFLRIGIFDFWSNGIVDTFRNQNKKEDKKILDTLRLSDFFDINSIVTTNLSRPEMRYAARMGIKTFVKTIVCHKGFFSVESCEHNDDRFTRLNDKINKRFLHTTEGGLSEVIPTEFVNGTHYEIILPVEESIPSKESSVLVQMDSVSQVLANMLRHPYPIRAIKTPMLLDEIAKSKDKDEQKRRIENACEHIIQRCKNKKEIALDLDNEYVSPVIVFKVAAFLQLKSTHPIDIIVLVNVTDDFTREFCSLIDLFLIHQGNEKIPVWNKNCAVIILCDNLHARIVWGKTKEELYYINHEYKRLYYNHFLDGGNKDNNPFDKGITDNSDFGNEAKDFVLPFDVLITTEENGKVVSPFEKFLDQLLRTPIISSGHGLLVNHENTYIGNKIIVKSFYEADTLFQNSFFVERFANQIARNLIEEVFENKEHKEDYKNKTLVLIGYKYYSEFLLKSIQDQISKINQINQRKTIKRHYSILVGLCNESRDSSGNDLTFIFDINRNEKNAAKAILDNPQQFLYATIVPIGATLSTNDKIVSFFKYWLNQNSKNKIEPTFVYNHCAIVVRDTVSKDNSTLEKAQRWNERSDPSEHVIETRFNNVKKVHFTVQIANKEDSNNANWVRRLNDSVSFPKKWQEEQYVNLTENSSINSQNLMDYPRVYCDNIIEEEELEHLYNLSKFIYKGHIQLLHSHHKYYIDTESFVREKKQLVEKWLEGIKSRIHFDSDTFNVLITPNVECESDFVSSVNDVVFNGSALILYLDVNNWRSNIVNKLSFLNDIPNVKYHYVDMGFLTGETYHRSKSYLFSIDERRDLSGFCYAFTIVNRLPYSRDKEIRNDLKQGFFSYVNLYYPICNDEHVCELCRLEQYYKDLSKKTVLQNCTEIILKNKEKIKLVDLDEVKNKHDDDNKEQSKWQRRVFLRLLITHWLFYRLSLINKDNKDKRNKVKEELDYIYSCLCGEIDSDNCLLNKKIDDWFCGKLFPEKAEIKELVIDKQISFLKVISSPPLSQYIAIREYAHEKLLLVLYDIIIDVKKGILVEDDLRIVKSILKSLSFLKSNALVRRDVIVGVWRVLEIVIKGMDEVRKREVIQDFSKDYLFFIKNSIVGDEAKATFLGELLRRGEEMTSFETTTISSTKLLLSKKNDLDNQAGSNILFGEFSKSDPLLRREYSYFLVWLFYDNTTIIRNTLINFSRELDKDIHIHRSFYDGEKRRSIDNIKKKIKETKDLFENKVKEEYYYSSFLPYLDNKDDIAYVEKMIYVTYAKLKLEDLTSYKKISSIEADTRDLMELFSAIMGADAAFWTMKKDDHIYPISTFGKLGSNMNRGWNYDEWFLSNNYYTSKRVYSETEVINFPIIPLYSIYRQYGESRDLKMSRLCILVVDDYSNVLRGNTNKKVVSTITFLYKKSTALFRDEEDFRKKVQESGRLLLLLKNDINKYVIDYLIKDKILDLWVMQYKSKRNFEKIYANNSHIFNNVYEEMREFDTLSFDTIHKLSRTWFYLTNETVGFLYSDIARNTISNGNRHYLNLDPSFIIDKQNTLSGVFSKQFIRLLYELLNTRWKSDGDINTNVIFINKKPIDNFILADVLSKIPIHCNKYILRTFITQCLHNSLSPLGKGHRRPNEVKRVDIIIRPSSITIKDCRLSKDKHFIDDDKKRSERFNEKKKYITDLICDEYSSTTLTSLQGVVQYLKDNGENFSCDYGFFDGMNFTVIINF